MINEAYVSFEVAKLFKEKGFPQDTFSTQCNTCYKYNGKFCNNVKSLSGVDREICFMAPTHQMAMAWLREEKNIFISISYRQHSYENSCCELCYDDCKYSYEINGINGNDAYNIGISINSYEEAVESALLYTLKNLI